MKYKFKIFWTILFFISILFTRFYNLEKTTRFTRDESQNLVDMHRIYVDREITFVGPINYGETIVYPSTTFYMLLPFAALGKFEPYSPALGTAFFGFLTVVVIMLITRELNRKILLLTAILLIVWFPFLETSRWAWNPHLVPFTSFLAIYLFFRKGPIYKLFSGFLFGLSFHLHYLTIVSFSIFGLYTFVISVRERKFKKVIYLALGFLIAIIPFVIFDLRNPPGLFFNYYIKNNLISSGAGGELTLFPKTFLENLYNVLVLLTQFKILAILVGLLLSLLIYIDLIKKSKSLIYLFPAFGQIIIISFLPFYENRYFYLGLPFFLVWLIYPRTYASMIVKLSIVLMITGSLFTVKKQLTLPIREPDTYSIRIITNHIKEIVAKDDRKNINIAALASPDHDPLAVIYRHTLQVKEVDLLADNQFDITDNLFVVTTSDEDKIRNDPANVMTWFRKGPVVERYDVGGTSWKVYLFNRNPK